MWWDPVRHEPIEILNMICCGMSLIINFVDAKVDSLLPLHLLQPLVVDGVNVFILGRKDDEVCQVL